jgi:membrane protease YdiL (CAAX protease family)
MASSWRSYFTETRRPVYSAALLLPFFAVYHLGTLLLGTTYVNGADALIVRLLSLLSVHSMFASALLLLLCFVLWQLKTRASWKVEPGRVVALFFESCFFSLLLFFVTGWLSVHLSRPLHRPGSTSAVEKLILYCGAGIYEELVFRGFLLGLLLVVLIGPLRVKKIPAAFTAAILAALIFAAFHYVGPAADSFSMAGFLQRTLGGLFFSALFVTRGFGVTAASHALYDVLVGLILA